jgi:hypothetical protein
LLPAEVGLDLYGWGQSELMSYVTEAARRVPASRHLLENDGPAPITSFFRRPGKLWLK